MGLFIITDVGKESDKAAQILLSFTNSSKIPPQAIAAAKGLAIFSAIRAGMYLAGSSGTGIVIARLSNGSWSPPSAFSVRSGSVGIVYGVDVYDCVCVLNTDAAVEAYAKPEMRLDGAVAFAAGPVGGNASLRDGKDVRGVKDGMDGKPVWTYTRSRGLYGGVTLDGTVVRERREANAEFYGERVSVGQILRGEVQWPAGARQLVEVLKLAEGKGADEKVLQEISTEPTPGDLEE